MHRKVLQNSAISEGAIMEASQSKAVHESLFSPAGLQLGAIHWRLLKAAQLMDERRWVREDREDISAESSFQSLSKPTDFGTEVANDEIHWWIFTREDDVDELRIRTEQVRASAQTLREASNALRTAPVESYEGLVSNLEQFVTSHRGHIHAVCQYVDWLQARDPLAPAMLFNYRIWGSTQMADRWIELPGPSLEQEKVAVLRQLTEIVLGLFSKGMSTWDRIRYEFEWEAVERAPDDEHLSAEAPMAWLAPRGAFAVYGECAAYFKELRDALDNVLLDVGKFVAQRDLMQSDSFWRALISKAIGLRRTEPQLWDFKEVLTMWVAPPMDREKGRVTFAEDVASFANANGGVLFLGIADNRDVVGVGRSAKEIENRIIEARKALEKLIDYEREIVTFREVPVRDREGIPKTCLAVVVARACRPVGVRVGNAYTYPIRLEAGLDRVSAGKISSRKIGLKCDDRDFMRELEQFVRLP
jgi:hypothetical protein